MTKEKLMAEILENSEIHHNISISWSKLPNYDEEDHFDPLEVGGELISQFADQWQDEPINDSGNRNLCACKEKSAKGQCPRHDLWHVYTAGRMGATLYWDKYWKESQGHYAGFKYDEDDLKEMSMSELITICDEINQFNKAVFYLMGSFYEYCPERLTELRAENKENARREAMGYSKTLSELLENENPQIVRLAKGIKTELNK